MSKKYSIKVRDLAGQRFGLLTVLEIDDEQSEKYKRIYWKCQCDCGKTNSIIADSLTMGRTCSCGCRKRLQHEMSYKRPYGIWEHMKARCLNKNNTHFKSYGGRGITLSSKWQKFQGFWEDMEEGYSDSLTLERNDVNGNYEKNNCSWATRKQQSNNRRNTVYYIIDGEKICQSDVIKKFGIPITTLQKRIRNGWEIERAISTPTDTRYQRIKVN